MKPLPISESDLHAYVDNVLPESLRAEVEDYLASHPDEAERLQAYQAQNLALKELFNPMLDEPIPDNLLALAAKPETVIPQEDFLRGAVNAQKRSIFSRWSLERIAAGLLIAVVSGVSGWLAHGQYQPPVRSAQVVPLPRQAAVAHVVFSPDVRRPVEVRAEQEDQLVTWLSKRLGTPVRPPKLGTLGYELIGGRLLPGNSGPVAQFMYHDSSGQRLTLYVTTENTANQDTGFRFAQEGPVNVFYWIDGKFGYALSAGIDKSELSRVATAVYDQLEH
ncbi:MAG: anti-sigma factor [Dechloromonas sp.]|uniref:Anti-sigma factor n=1 Tax=Candidatus Dechloromonas phosphorivorans TaxID=2899244 RepID=A0A935MSK2_9RHOO|nr:anti-sigma factor [Candidatus Dechloromonas phosphorivorans]